jgi:hypothetical protein
VGDWPHGSREGDRGGNEMTDSPINLDEAHRMIGEYQANRMKYPGVSAFRSYIDMAYLERIVSELESGRERIADLESQVNDNQGNIDDAFEMGCKKVGRIIPRAEDAKILQNDLEGVELAQKLTGLSYRDEIELLKRYLTAIEGGHP